MSVWGGLLLHHSVTFWGPSTPLFSVMVLNVWGVNTPLFSMTVLGVWGGVSLPLIQCNGFGNSGEGLSENAATDQYNS